MNQFSQNLTHDPIHGYIRFVAPTTQAEHEICERSIIDNPWVGRMRQIRQLQTAWWVFPSAEHSRFQHILGVMHLASKAVHQLYSSLKCIDSTVPELPVVESIMRMAGLLHDVGHGPFGHFFDANYLSRFGLTHEILGALIIENRLSDQLSALRESPTGRFEQPISPADIAWLIQRPTHSGHDDLRIDDRPVWLSLLRSLFCGIYTVDNMDFVLRDAFMTGLNPRAFDIERILHYSEFRPEGLTISDRGIPALVHFLSMKAELFRNVYFHRTVRAIDLQLSELFRDSFEYIFPGDPRNYLDEYLEFTEFSLLTDVRRWHRSPNPGLSKLGSRWLDWLNRKTPWKMVCQRNISFSEQQSENSSIFSSTEVFAASVRQRLPKDLRSTPFQVDLARHIHRPHTRGVTAGLNFFHDTSTDKIRPITMHGLYKQLPISHTIARIYCHDISYRSQFAVALDELLGAPGDDDLTNM
jgi:uncharacterized protein